MPFFDAEAEPTFLRSTPRRRRWRGNYDDTLGVPLAYAEYLVHSEDLALIVSGLVAYPTGRHRLAGTARDGGKPVVFGVQLGDVLLRRK